MTNRFVLSPAKLVLAIVLMVVGAILIVFLRQQTLEIGGNDISSIAILIAALVFYSGILVIVSMFQNETMLAIALLMPSLVAVAIFVYGFIGWSIRVSLSKWQGLLADYTIVGLKQYSKRILREPR